jgi:hypothetical protein
MFLMEIGYALTEKPTNQLMYMVLQKSRGKASMQIKCYYY